MRVRDTGRGLSSQGLSKGTAPLHLHRKAEVQSSTLHSKQEKKLDTCRWAACPSEPLLFPQPPAAAEGGVAWFLFAGVTCIPDWDWKDLDTHPIIHPPLAGLPGLGPSPLPSSREEPPPKAPTRRNVLGAAEHHKAQELGTPPDRRA